MTWQEGNRNILAHGHLQFETLSSLQEGVFCGFVLCNSANVDSVWFTHYTLYVGATGVSNSLTAVQQTLENSLGFAYIKPSSLAFAIVWFHFTRR